MTWRRGRRPLDGRAALTQVERGLVHSPEIGHSFVIVVRQRMLHPQGRSLSPRRQAGRPWYHRSMATDVPPTISDATPPDLDSGGTLHEGGFELLLEKHGGKVAAPAETAGPSRVYLYRLLGRYGLFR